MKFISIEIGNFNSNQEFNKGRVVSLNANDVLLNLMSLYFLSDFLIWFLPTESLLVCPWQRVCFDIVIMNVYDLL